MKYTYDAGVDNLVLGLGHTRHLFTSTLKSTNIALHAIGPLQQHKNLFPYSVLLLKEY